MLPAACLATNRGHSLVHGFFANQSLAQEVTIENTMIGMKFAVCQQGSLYKPSWQESLRVYAHIYTGLPMAKKSTGNGKSRVRVFAFEIEGDDSTLQGGLQAMAAAINKTFEPRTQAVIKRIAHSTDDSVDHDDEGDIIDAVTEDGDEFGAAPVSSSGGNGKTRIPPKMKTVPDLDLHMEERESFESFYGRHKHRLQKEQIVLAVYYLEQILELTSITPHHVYTCLDSVEGKMPNDLPQAMRNIVSREGWMTKGKKKNEFSMSMPGINHVKKKLATSQTGEAE